MFKCVCVKKKKKKSMNSNQNIKFYNFRVFFVVLDVTIISK